MPEGMPDRISEDMPDRMPEGLPHKMPEDMPEDMPDRMPEGMPVTKRINVMVGITQSKIFFSPQHHSHWFLRLRPETKTKQTHVPPGIDTHPKHSKPRYQKLTEQMKAGSAHASEKKSGMPANCIRLLGRTLSNIRPQGGPRNLILHEAAQFARCPVGFARKVPSASLDSPPKKNEPYPTI